MTSDSGVVDADVLDAAGPDVPAQPDLSVSDIADVQPSDIPTVEISDVPEVGSPDIAEIEIPDVPEVQTPDTSEVQSPDTADVAVVPPGPCCEPHQGTGCEIPTCQLMVCTLDSYCCETQWDEFCTACAGGGATLGGESCAGLFEACGCQPPPPPTAFELAEHWAPVWYHDTDDSEPTADYITAFDFDGNTASNDNWQGLVEEGSDLSAVIYWSFIETPTHWFITYADFHPRDWTEVCTLPFVEPCHENDMEGAMVAVRRDDTDFGTFEALYTEAHNTLHIHVTDPAITKGTGHLESVAATFENGSHPELYVEAKGHGVCALYFEAGTHCNHPTTPSPPPFPGGDGIVYRYKGTAEVPSSGNDSDVGYALLPLETTLWPRRFDTCGSGCTFDGTFDYLGTALAVAFDGDDGGTDKANPVWAWDDPDDGPVFRGDHFFRPAHALATHLNVVGPVSQTYTVNPYLDSLE